ncbi:MAG: hypothetical protein QOH37_714 [Nocardioidaceae bacterium]|jgi:hypothetical protein|nr:hypothetical protein [Nocardioidaceae bacterium]
MDDDVAAVTDLVRGLWVGLAMRAMVDLRIPDHTREPCPLTDLAGRTGCPPRQLTRLLATLRDAGLVDGDDDDGWQATSLGLVLASDHPTGLHRRLTSRTWPPTLAAWSHLSEALVEDQRTFGRPVEATQGESFWEAMNRNPLELETFNATMAGRGRDQAASLLEATDVAEVGRVVDVGAGRGATLAALLPRVPGLRGVVADRPSVLPEAMQNLAEQGLADRCEVLPADFFDAVPAGGDAYVLGNILHDWPDDDCLRILSVVRTAMGPHSRLWVLEHVLDPQPPRPARAQAEVHLLDLHMLVLFGGRERTRAEYAALLTASGFSDPSCTSTSTGWDVLAARPLGR